MGSPAVAEQRRLRALKIGLALLAVIPAGRLPNYLPGEIASDAAGKRSDPIRYHWLKSRRTA
jgi:hypothetical protein